MRFTRIKSLLAGLALAGVVCLPHVATSDQADAPVNLAAICWPPRC